MKVKVISKLNRRLWPSTKNQPLPYPLFPNDTLEVVEEVNGEALAPGNNTWYKTDQNFYVWSGGVETTGILKPTPQALEAFRESDYWWLADFNIGKLWNEGLSGRDIKIAVLDSGLSLPHPDLIIESSNQQDLSGINVMTDPTGHGTHVAGIIKASNNGFGIKGIAFNSEFYFGKITNDNSGDNVKYLINGVEWAIKNGVHIISISNGEASNNAILKKSIEKAISENILIICAAGNKNESPGNDILYPARYSNVLSIGGLTKTKDMLPDTINAGQTNLFAPGENILSTHLNKSYKSLTGSSQATPFVAGVAALLLEASKKIDPSCNAIEIKDKLLESADEKTFAKIINPLEALKLIST